MSWKTVCSTDEVGEHSIKLFDVDGVSILVANVGDGFRAYPPVCPHMEEPLIESGICANGQLTCTKHLWQWDMRTGEPKGPAEKCMLLYEVKAENGQVLVNLEQELEYDFDEDDDDDY
ncbi:(2Fe-2S)-binding protein [Chromatiales bacterium (ex Bugula neritina AB1)]|nr:(2Fe-2S)-binding protein [Chromatiales bacterium (ex Bugula neritina AB1)]